MPSSSNPIPSIASLRQVHRIGSRPSALRPLWRLAAAANLALALVATALIPPQSDVRVYLSGPQADAPVDRVAPTWDNLDATWFQRFQGPNHRVSPTQAYRVVVSAFSDLNPSTRPTPEQMRHMTRLLLDTGSPTLYRSPATLRSVERSEEVFPRPSQAPAFLSNARVLKEALYQQWASSIDTTHEASVCARLPVNLTQDQARKALTQALVATDLAGLHVPWPYWENPDRLWCLAQQIIAADAEIAHVTGWPGHPLGLHGRVVLTIGEPSPGRAGITYQDSRGYVHIHATFGVLAHEWFHGVDNAMAQDLMALPAVNRTYSDQRHRWLHRPASSPESVAWRQAWDTLWVALRNPPLSPAARTALDKDARLDDRGEIDEASITNALAGLARVQHDIRAAPTGTSVPRSGSPWLTWRARAAQYQRQHDCGPESLGGFSCTSPMAEYLTAEEELIAFSFGAQANTARNAPVLALTDNTDQIPAYEPRHIESTADAAPWKAFFHATAGWWARDALRRTPPSVDTAPPSVVQTSEAPVSLWGMPFQGLPGAEPLPPPRPRKLR